MKAETDPLALAAAAFRQGDRERAQQLCRHALDCEPGRAQAWVLAAKLAQGEADFGRLLQAARRAAELAPAEVGIQLLWADALVLNGRLTEARAVVAVLTDRARGAADWAAIGQFHTAATDYGAALAAYRRAAELAPGDPAGQANLASALATIGATEAAGKVLDQLLAAAPLDADAHYNRATLRRVNPAHNHIPALRAALRQQPPDAAPLHYALAKEYEDCGEHPLAWQQLQRGAALRRARLSYKVERDEQAIADIASRFDARWWRRQQVAASGARERSPGPVFVLGLPRSGTTLVDRMLASHSQVASLGEINDFAFALMRAAGPHRGKADLMALAAALELAPVGQDYLASTEQYGAAAPRLIDKTPLNFLYLGLLVAALPGARIVHLRRHPLASCHALYKTLFRMACPFSYDLDDLGRYYIAYHTLMQHWRRLLGDAWLDLDYEQLVQQPEPVARELLAYCGLEWEPECLEFHRNPAPVATASAAQVRQPIHRESLALWRHHREALAPLAARLERAGIGVD